MAPEILLNKFQGYKNKVDIWSFGCIFYQLIVGVPPFFGKTPDDVIQTLKERTYTLHRGLALSDEGINFLQRCLCWDPDKRIEWAELINHDYLLKTDVVKLQAERENSGLLESVCIDVAAPLQMENSNSDVLGLQEFLQQRADAFDDALFKTAIGKPQDLSELLSTETTMKESK